MTSTEAPFSYTLKVGPQGNLLTGRADTKEEMALRIVELGELASIINGENPVEYAKAALGATDVTQQASPAAPAPAPAAVAGPEVVTGKYGDQWTYGLAEAPQLPDGRGFYAKRSWNDKSGTRRVAWVDPAKGPKPFPVGAVEAKLQWI